MGLSVPSLHRESTDSLIVFSSCRAKMGALAALPQFQKCYVPTSTNAAYGCVETTECEMFDMLSGATIATQGPINETVPN